jgi:hypothetical protein
MFYALVYSLVVPVSAAADDTKLTYLDIQPQTNQKLSRDQGDLEGNNLKNVPTGEQELGGLKFKIGESMIHLKGEFEPDLPAKVAGIKVDAPFTKLYILHSTCHGAGMGEQEEKSEVAAYVIHYADKSEERIPVLYGEDVRDWWFPEDSPGVTKGKVAWVGTNPPATDNSCKIRLYSKVWTNPNPDKKVETIDYESKNTKCDPFLIGLTIE